MIHFYPLQIKDIRKETPDCVSIAFEVPAGLQSTFSYRHGQYLTIKAIIEGEEVRRSYSVCSSPLENELRIAVKKVEDGRFSKYANEQLKKGDIIEAMPPIGKFFTPLHHQHQKSYIAFAAGSGITPILSIIKTTLLTEPQSNFTLVYGNRNRHSIIFKEELEGLKNRYIDRFRVIHILSREKMDAAINFGRIDEAKCRQLFEKILDAKTTDEFFICGPEEMTFAVKFFLEQQGIDKKKIHFELFNASSKKPAILTSEKENDKAQSTITIRLDGASFNFNLGYDSISILDAALQRGADLPFACKGGVCCTCRAKLVEGEVEMDVNYALEPEELEQGFILACQSHPKTEKVVVDFDSK